MWFKLNKVMKELKKNKYASIAIIGFFVLIILGFGLYKFLFPNAGSPVYGNRLDGIEAVAISKDDLKNINAKLEEQENIISVKSDVSGRTVNFTLTVKEGTKAADAKKYPLSVVQEFTEEQRAYFDFQVFITSENKEENGYPIIGYMNKNNDEFSFSSAS